MPHAIASSDGVAPVEAYERALRDLLGRARQVKPDGGIEPSLRGADFGDSIESLRNLQVSERVITVEERLAAAETAIRRLFYETLASTSIEEPAFTQVWSLLDLTTILSDNDLCEFNLSFWLVEELLESQTLEGCRRVFDYLESRRKAMIAKHYGKKYLTILRACNDLLKRLSRAEDTVFCGRVFIYLFSTLTFGDRSSVNLRGEFHVANSTTYDQIPAQPAQDSSAMDDIQKGEPIAKPPAEAEATITLTEPTQGSDSKPASVESKTVRIDDIKDNKDQTLDYDALYPIFWSLQEYYSKPNSLFEPESLATFKHGLEATLAKFKQIHKESDAGGLVAHGDETKHSLKRKWQGDEETSKAAFNPKYLTSRDLFELELSDLGFRRHVLVQGLILIDFLLSQTPKAKAKLEHLKNKSVLYSFTLDDEQAKWAENMRLEIAAYLQQGVEGKFYYRMVDTVLSRDKNWVYWKAESCPLFSRPPIAPSEYAEARNGAKRAAAIRRPKNNPLGALDLNFLSSSNQSDGLDRLRDPSRFEIPAMDSYKKQIEGDVLDLDFANTEEEKEQLREARASKLWRTLRIASKSKFSVFDKIDDGNKLDVLFASSEDTKAAQEVDTDTQGEKTAEDQEGNSGTDGTVEPSNLHDENTQPSADIRSQGPTMEESRDDTGEPEGTAAATKDSMDTAPDVAQSTEAIASETTAPKTVEETAVT